MTRVSLFVISALCLAAAVAPGLAGESGQTPFNAPVAFYVSPDGNDSWSGALPAPNAAGSDGPFATLQAAQYAVRAHKLEHGLQTEITVYLRGGTYFMDQPATFTPADSGTAEFPIRYAAFPGERPVLAGSRPIGGIVMTEPGVAKVRIPGAENRGWIFHQLFVNGERWQKARTPNGVYLYLDGRISPDKLDTIRFRGADIKAEWLEEGEVEFVGLSKWAEARIPIQSVDPQTREAVLAKPLPPSNWQNHGEQRYWLENVKAGLDAPGEWYLDRETGELTILCDPSMDLSQAEVTAPAPESLIVLQGDMENRLPVEYLSFEGLTFTQTAAPKLTEGYPDVQAAHDISAAFRAEGARRCAVRDCAFVAIGNYAIEFGRGCKRNRADGNCVSDTGAGGVKIGEPRMREEDFDRTENNAVADNHIHDIGKIYPAAVGVWIGQSSGNFIAHNRIHDTYYTGISVGWSWGYNETRAHNNRIEFNHVHRIGRGLLSDMGGIYLLGDSPGTAVRNNLFHDISSYGYGGWGIYTDEGSTHILIENNVVHHTKSAGFHQHYGKENMVRNNIFAFGKEYQIMRTRNEEHVSFFFERNIVLWEQGELLGSNWGGPERYRFDNNLYWKVGGEPFNFKDWTLEEWRKNGMDEHGLIADPELVQAGGAYTIGAGSPAFALGILPIDVSAAGPRRPCRCGM